MRRLVVRLVLAAAVVALVAWEHELSAGRQAARSEAHRIGPLLTADERASMQVAAVSLERGDGTLFEYLRLGGIWRCVSHFGAVALDAKLRRLVDAILGAEGVLQSDDPERAADYGIGTEDTWTVRLHGTEMRNDPDGDVLFTLEVGHARPGLGGCYVRRPDHGVVWSIDTDPRGIIAPPGSGTGPPMLDTRVVSSLWPPEGQRPVRFAVERAGQAAYAVELRERVVDDEEIAAGAVPWEWTLVDPDESETPLEAARVVPYTLYVLGAESVAIADPRQAEELGMDRPQAILRIRSSAGETLSLVFGPTREDGLVPVINSVTRTLVLVQERTFDLMLPSRGTVASPDPVTPWDEALR